MGKLVLFFAFFFSSSTMAFDHFFHNEIIRLTLLKSPYQDHAPLIKGIPINIHSKYLSDPQNIINNEFLIPSYFNSSTSFWFDIYTMYDQNQILLYDRYDHSILYEVLDLSSLYNSFDPFVSSNLRYKIIQERFNHYHTIFKSLLDNQKTLANSGLPISLIQKIESLTDSQLRDQFILELAFSIRAQTGLKNTVEKGIGRYNPFGNLFTSLVERAGLPKELVALSFVESSFTPEAVSKVGASGLWQIMPAVGKSYLPMNESVDGRNGPILSTLAAIKLLKYNFKTLKRWDLAVSAYNSGAKHFLLSRIELKKPNASLEEILKTYRHPHLGYAATNFYSEFLAMTHALFYSDKIFEVPTLQTNILENPVSAYLNHCPISPRDFFDRLKSPPLLFLNMHFKNFNRPAPVGSIFISDRELRNDLYTKVSDASFSTKNPRDWKLKKMSNTKELCSDLTSKQ